MTAVAPSASDAHLITDAEAATAASRLAAVQDSLNQVLFGQEALVAQVLTGVLAGGHLLLEGLPGLGKTELAKGLAAALGLTGGRIQFTPDLLPGDITGNPILEETPAGRRFVFKPGPIFANLVLADEVNRASPKTQSAMLEAMQEAHVTTLGERHALPQPFIVIATQNPIELEGTYPLPEAQLDRFLFKLEVTRNPVAVLERIISGRQIGQAATVAAVLTPGELVELKELTRRVFLAPALINYIARLVDGTHGQSGLPHPWLRFGASPRAALALAAGARARALLHGRIHAGFEDVRAVAVPVLQHRVVLSHRARLEGQTGRSVVESLLAEVLPHGRAAPGEVSAR